MVRSEKQYSVITSIIYSFIIACVGIAVTLLTLLTLSIDGSVLTRANQTVSDLPFSLNLGNGSGLIILKGIHYEHFSTVLEPPERMSVQFIMIIYGNKLTYYVLITDYTKLWGHSSELTNFIVGYGKSYYYHTLSLPSETHSKFALIAIDQDDLSEIIHNGDYIDNIYNIGEPINAEKFYKALLNINKMQIVFDWKTVNATYNLMNRRTIQEGSLDELYSIFHSKLGSIELYFSSKCNFQFKLEGKIYDGIYYKEYSIWNIPFGTESVRIHTINSLVISGFGGNHIDAIASTSSLVFYNDIEKIINVLLNMFVYFIISILSMLYIMRYMRTNSLQPNAIISLGSFLLSLIALSYNNIRKYPHVDNYSLFLIGLSVITILNAILIVFYDNIEKGLLRKIAKFLLIIVMIFIYGLGISASVIFALNSIRNFEAYSGIAQVGFLGWSLVIPPYIYVSTPVLNMPVSTYMYLMFLLPLLFSILPAFIGIFIKQIKDASP